MASVAASTGCRALRCDSGRRRGHRLDTGETAGELGAQLVTRRQLWRSDDPTRAR
jgi:hypothetical protein